MERSGAEKPDDGGGRLTREPGRRAAAKPPRRTRPPREPGGRPRRAAPTGPEISALMRDRLIESRLTPNAISMTGLVLNVAAAVLIWEQQFVIAGIVFILGSVCDTLDGRYARTSGKGTPFGAFLDSTLDRIEEGVVLTAVAYYFAETGKDLAVAAVVVAVLASLMVSYTRARAEALGVACKVGLATRAVRVAIISAGVLFADLGVLEPAVYVLAALSVFTVLQRILHVRRELNAAV
jgi:CDP-diacylglycerol---glycerol-3-phosphate 3-phosphatidyltransferase